MEKDSTGSLSNIIRIDDDRIQDHLGRIVRGAVDDTLNASHIDLSNQLYVGVDIVPEVIRTKKN